jgi:hypothetical protein
MVDSLLSAFGPVVDSDLVADLRAVNFGSAQALAAIAENPTGAGITLPARALEAMANLIRSQTQEPTTTEASEALGDRSILANECIVVGQLDLNQRTQALLDRHFSFVDVSLSDRIAYKVRKDVVPRELVDALDDLISDTQCQTLRSTGFISSKVKGYDRPLSDGYLGVCGIGVQGSQGKNESDMGKFLNGQGMHFSERLNSLISLKLNLLLRGENPFEGGREFRDSCGVLHTRDGRLRDDGDFRHRIFSHDKLSALGSPN